MALCISRLWWCLLLVYVEFEVVFSDTDPGDAEALRALKDQWRNTPPSWGRSNDPCSWEGVTCSSSRIVSLALNTNNLTGEIPSSLGLLSKLYWLDLAENHLTGSIPVSSDTKPGLDQLKHAKHLLSGNPVCATALAHTAYCRVQQQTSKAYSTSLTSCGSKLCPSDQKLSPQTCDCAYPYEGTLYFRAPSFRELSNINVWHSLEMSLWVKLGLTPGSVSLQNPFFNTDDYLQVYLQLFPSKSKHFNRSEIQMMGFYLSNQTYKPPAGFGPYFFIATPYVFSDGHGGASIGVGTVVGIATASTILVIMLIGLLLYAVRQKKRAEKAIGLSRPFASWASSGKEGGGAPQLKGARWFSYDELKKCTSNFSDDNQIGSVAIKRAQQASRQGGHEFKTEIELLSRVHHKNLVGLVGFCFEQGEQMLVYEFMPNGTLRDSLTGEYLDH
ncbi:Concanavalin A-like lectin/glucanase, subgroup [Cynara cardunculus var. scolymus]|uniref:non-specific serine/threonine protein kinase n=1 Tax=Cynara cardunculus var. scolymus TaxID=59895 RepID=A0A103Y1N4_CYNCS|nr:Concanavalin A-like lectin/glucanase, subgroup [Cynara cardunculus var. scolymus]